MTYARRTGMPVRPGGQAPNLLIPHTSIQEVQRLVPDLKGFYNVSVSIIHLCSQIFIIFELARRFCQRNCAIWLPVDRDRRTQRRHPRKGNITVHILHCQNPEGMENILCQCQKTWTLNNILSRVERITKRIQVRYSTTSLWRTQRKTTTYIGKLHLMSCTATLWMLFLWISALQHFLLHVRSIVLQLIELL